MLEIEHCNVNNPNEFWTMVNRLGPQKKHEIPWEVEINGEHCFDHDKILDKWREEFNRLYKINSNEFNDMFKQQKVDELNEL